MFLFENTDHYLNFPSQPPHWLPGVKPVGLVELKKPMEGVYFFCTPQQIDSIGEVQGATWPAVGAAAGYLSFGVDLYGSHVKITNLFQEADSPVKELAQRAQNGYAIFCEFRIPTITSATTIFKFGGSTNSGSIGITLVSGTVTFSVSGGGSTNAVGLFGTGDLIRVGYCQNGGTGDCFMKNVTTGDVHINSSAASGASSNVATLDLGDPDATIHLYNLWLDENPWSPEDMRDLVFCDPYQLLIPA